MTGELAPGQAEIAAALLAAAREQGLEVYLLEGRLGLRGPAHTRGLARRVLVHRQAVFAVLFEAGLRRVQARFTPLPAQDRPVAAREG